MTPAIKAIVANPSLLGLITSEQLLDPEDKVIANAMEVIVARGLRPSIPALRHLFASTEGGSEYIEMLKEIEMSPLSENDDPQLIVESARQDYNDELLGTALMECMRMVKKERADVVMSQFGELTSQLITSTRTDTTRDIADRMMQGIQDVMDGKTKAYWQTGQPLFDSIASLSPREIIVAAAQKKQGKTRFIVDRMMRLHKYNPELSFIWYSLEMKPEEVTMCQVAYLTGIYTNVLEGKSKNRITPDELVKIKRAHEYIREMPIRFVDRAKGIDPMLHDLRRWIKGPSLVVIDNLGLVEMEHGMTDIQHEDKMAKRLVQIRDELDPCIIGLHHLSKESESKWQRDDFYRPKVVHVRGSSRIADYANQVWLMHRPGAYKDLWRGMNALVPPSEVEAFLKSFTLDIALNRGGESGEIAMTHELGRSKFTELPLAA